MKKFILTALFYLISLTSSAYALEVASYIPENPQSALIMIHGYNQSGNRMTWMTEKLKHLLPNTAFYYPTAPEKAPSGGNQWFFLPTFNAEMINVETYGKMLKNALKNTNTIHQTVENIHKQLHISYENIHIAGFSQGGLMALLTGLSNQNSLGKIISFSGVPLVSTPDFNFNVFQNSPNILLIQGNRDNVIPSDSINMTELSLTSIGIIPQTEMISDLGHSINDIALHKMVDFIKNK